MSNITRTSTGNSGSEDKFIELFCDTFGAEKGQYPCRRHRKGQHSGRSREHPKDKSAEPRRIQKEDPAGRSDGTLNNKEYNTVRIIFTGR